MFKRKELLIILILAVLVAGGSWFVVRKGPVSKDECKEKTDGTTCTVQGDPLQSGYCYQGQCLPPRVASCEDIPTGPELTFLMSYCSGGQCTSICDENGENCREVATKEECESIDVVAIDEDGKLKDQWEKDGQPDCIWVGGEDPANACRPKW